MIPRFVVPFVLTLSLASGLPAQDSRTVIEPFFPQLCTTLDANLRTDGHSLAPADEQKLDTARIQKAIDKCGKGRAVLLHVDEENNAFLSGPLELKPEVTLIVGVGVTLFASRDPALYAVSPGSCGVVSHGEGPSPQRQGPVVGGPEPHGCRPFISIDRAPRTAIMGDGAIDGRGGEKMLGSQYSWWNLAEQPGAAGEQQAPGLIAADSSDNFTLYRITLRNSPNFHVAYNHGDGLTVWGLRIDTPQLARNTGGVDLGEGSKNITITHSYIRANGDDVAIKGGPGGVSNITVSHNHFYQGHGMSVGSEANGSLTKIRIFDLSLDGSGNGIRIKSNGSRGGLAHDVDYDDVCIRNSPEPITLDAAHSVAGTLEGNSPLTKDITLHNVRISGGGKFTFNGHAHDERLAATLDGVQIVDDAPYTYEVEHADLTLGPGPTNLQLPGGEDSAVTGTPAEGDPASCTEKFVPFPQ